MPLRGGLVSGGTEEDPDYPEKENRTAPAVPRLQAMAIPAQHSVPAESASAQTASSQAAGSLTSAEQLSPDKTGKNGLFS